MSTYQKWCFELPRGLEEVFGAELWRHGTEGIEEPGSWPPTAGSPDEPAAMMRLVAYFSDPAPAAAEAFDLAPWATRGVVWLSREILPVRDWLAEYRAMATPLDVGRCFRLDPREPDPLAAPADADGRAADAPSRFLLRLPARTAFGTGSHESTRLALLLLERLADQGQMVGKTVLDVGTGSGVLAFAALRLGARRVVAYDIDLASVCMAETNGRLNALAPLWLAGGPAALAPATRFDVLAINVLPERIAADLPSLVQHLAAGGRLLSSGNLTSQRAQLDPRFAALGLRPEGELCEGEWLALSLVRDP